MLLHVTCPTGRSTHKPWQTCRNGGVLKFAAERIPPFGTMNRQAVWPPRADLWYHVNSLVAGSLGYRLVADTKSRESSSTSRGPQVPRRFCLSSDSGGAPVMVTGYHRGGMPQREVVE